MPARIHARRLLDLPKDVATVGTVIIRLATLWFGVAVGLVAFALLTRRLGKQGISLEADLAAAEDADPTG